MIMLSTAGCAQCQSPPADINTTREKMVKGVIRRNNSCEHLSDIFMAGRRVHSTGFVENLNNWKNLSARVRATRPVSVKVTVT